MNCLEHSICISLTDECFHINAHFTLTVAGRVKVHIDPKLGNKMYMYIVYLYSEASRYAEVQTLHTQLFIFCSKDWDVYNLDDAIQIMSSQNWHFLTPSPSSETTQFIDLTQTVQPKALLYYKFIFYIFYLIIVRSCMQL